MLEAILTEVQNRMEKSLESTKENFPMLEQEEQVFLCLTALL